MPELPEMFIIADQMNKTIRGKIVESVSIYQQKCLNRQKKDYMSNLPGRKIFNVCYKGKWLKINFDNDLRFFISLGMGGEICFFKPGDSVPEKSRFILRFEDKSGFFITLWWFGYFHLVLNGETHQMTDSLGPDPIKMNINEFYKLLEKRRGKIKSFLLNQKHVRGIGNFYIQEILFNARIHPLRDIPSLTMTDKERLFNAIKEVLKESIKLGSSSYEFDFFQKKGQYSIKKMSIAYKEDADCPVCGSKIEKIQTGSTKQYICLSCQSL
jgi:formamidopyrimidine-DNA glycosylase